MKTLSQLTDFYYNTLHPILQELEEDRRKLKKKILFLAVFYTIIYLLVILFFVQILFQDLEAFLYALTPYFLLGAFFYRYLIKDYKSEFKNKIIKPLIHEIDSSLIFTPKLHVLKETFLKSKIFTASIDKYDGNDYVRGRINNTKIQFSDVHARTIKKSSKGDSYDTVFQGLFIVADFNKHLKGRTVVLPDIAQSVFGDLIGNWLQSNNFKREELVKLDNTLFEKEFVVYATDQIEARYILSPTLMNRLLLFQKKSKHNISISFIDSSIYLAIAYNKDLFEATVFRSLLDYKVAMEYIQTLHLVIGIVEELKLNEKLWSKQ